MRGHFFCCAPVFAFFFLSSGGGAVPFAIASAAAFFACGSVGILATAHIVPDEAVAVDG